MKGRILRPVKVAAKQEREKRKGKKTLFAATVRDYVKREKSLFFLFLAEARKKWENGLYIFLCYY